MDNLGRTLGKLLVKNVKSLPDQEVLGWIEEDKVLFHTFNEYYQILERMALGLHSLGLNSNNKVSILGQTSLKWHLFDMAVICARGVVVPIYPTYTSSEIKYIVNHSQSSFIVVDDLEQFNKLVEIQDSLKELKAIIVIEGISKSEKAKFTKKIKIISYSELLEIGHKNKEQFPLWFDEKIEKQKGTDTITLIYTSGTTGNPKGTLITNHAFCMMLENTRLTFKGKFTIDDCSLTFLPLSHVLGRCDSMVFLVLGYKTVYAQSLEKLVENFAVVKPTIMFAVPRIFEKVYAKVGAQIRAGSIVKQKIFEWANTVTTEYYSKIDKEISPSMKEIMQKKLAYKLVFSKIYEKFGGRIRYLISGGAPLAVSLIKFFRNANLTILEGYGLTETIAPCCVNPTWRQVAGTVGIPMGDVQLGFAEDGEILIKTEAMFQEYYNEPELTKEVFKDGWFATGDIGELTSEGYLKITDRKKDIIITSGGKNIAPQKLENAAKVQKYISQLMVIGDRRKYLTAVVGLEKERFEPYLIDLGLDSNCTVEDIAKSPKVIELIQLDIDEVNSSLARFETIKKFYIAPEEFTVEAGLMTPSMKLRKKILAEKYKNEIELMYSSDQDD